MGKVIRVRRKNNATKTLGIHMTLTKVVNIDSNQYGFAMTDDNESVYLPPSIIKRENMSAEDEGAGFTAPVSPNSRVDNPNAPKIVATLPVKWDDDDPEMIEVPDVAPADDPVCTDEDWKTLTDAASDVIDLIGPLDDIVKKGQQVIQGMQHLVTKAAAQRDAIKKFQRILDDVAPED